MRYALGMVLSGGGARGLGHVGVLKALGEEGIEPQVLSGTSAGAIVAALHAAGHSPEAMLEFFVRKSPFRLSKVTLSKPGIFDTDKVVEDFKEYFPEDSFEALHKPIFLTATDLVEGKLEVFATGRLIPAMLASASTPLVFAPTEVDGRLYSDGGILDNFPVEPLIGHCDVILGSFASELRAVTRRDLRTSLAVSQRALEIGMYHNSRRKFHHCDLVIGLDELSAFGTFDTKRFAQMMEIGYQVARRNMERIREVVGNRGRITARGASTGQL
jgi:NTE family protein